MGDAAKKAEEVLVEPTEDVCRLCFSAKIPISRDSKHPNQIDPDTNLIRLEEIGWEDVKDRGFSLQRRHLYSYAEAVAEAARRNSMRLEKGVDARYELAGVLIAAVGRISGIQDDSGKQVFRVLQTPTEEQPAHSEIRIAEHLQRKDLLKFRKSLQAALGTMQAASALDEHPPSALENQAEPAPDHAGEMPGDH